MKNLDSKQQVTSVLNNIIKKDNKEIYSLFLKELVETGKMTIVEVKGILSSRTNLESVPTEVLYWVYKTISKYNKELKPESEYFEEKEIKQAEIFQIKRPQSQYPLKFKILDKLNPNEDYLITLSAKEINQLQESGVIILDPEMQRESEITCYHGQLISHISYDDDRARIIGDCMASNDYFADTIRLILIQNGEEKHHISNNNELVIESGDIALIDGNHRTRGTEYALLKNDKIDLRLPIILSVGTVKTGQKIINQSEKRQPINRELLKTYNDSPESSIVKRLTITDELDIVYKFCKTKEEIAKDYGFLLESSLASNIKKWYDLSNASKKQENSIKNWLVEFLNSLADYFNQDFRNYQATKKIRWNVSYNVFAGYIYLSSVLYGKDNWEELLVKILDSIDFSIQNRPWKEGVSNAEKLVENYFEGVVASVLG
jgi:hypothetical protein